MPTNSIFRRHFRRGRRAELDSTSETQKDPKENGKNPRRRWVLWVKLALSASVPLMIAIFTVVTYIQQTQIEERNRQQDEGIANMTRLKDEEIANMTRLKDWDIAMANLRIANETKIQDRLIAEEDRQEDRRKDDDLRYETLYTKYIDDISTVIYKEPGQNESTFVSEEKKMLYIRRKTLITLRGIDSGRKSQLFIFLYENNLLTDKSKPNSTILLEGADLSNILIKSPLVQRYEFTNLSLVSVNLVNASFINCEFIGETNFTGSTMSNISFIGSGFNRNPSTYETITLFDQVSLDYADFRQTYLVNVHFKNVNLSYSKFHDAIMLPVNFTSKTLLVYSDWGETMNGIYSVSISDTNLSGSTIDLKKWWKVSNVVLPNGTWLIDNENLVKNGDAEKDCTLFNGIVPGWTKVNGTPSLHHNTEYSGSNSTSFINVGNCSFASSPSNEGYYRIKQELDISRYTLFTASEEATFGLSAYFGTSDKCKQGNVGFGLYDINDGKTLLNYTNPDIISTDNSIEWIYRNITYSRSVYSWQNYWIFLEFQSNSSSCYVDNIEIYYRKR